MAIFEDLKKLGVHIARGDLASAVGDVGHTVNDAVNIVTGVGIAGMGMAGMGIPGTAAPSPSQAPQIGPYLQAPPGISGVAPHNAGSCSGVVVPPPPRSAAPVAPPCCDRFRFDSGFLVDGATGSVWQYDQETKSFEAVPVNHGKTKQSLLNSLVEARLTELKQQYENEVLGTTEPALRPAKLAAFDKDHLAQLRAAAQALNY